MKFYIIIFLALWSSWAFAQEKWIGLHSSAGYQSVIPFNSGSYTYQYKSIGINYKWLFKENKKWSFYWSIQPTYSVAHHQLTNPWYRLDERDDIYARKIPQYQELKTIREYVLNFGFIPQLKVAKFFSVFGLVSIGPMFTDTETERLARGLAFSDRVAMGILFHKGIWEIGMQVGVRHVSNANLLFPNNGHNASFIGMQIGYSISQLNSLSIQPTFE